MRNSIIILIAATFLFMQGAGAFALAADSCCAKNKCQCVSGACCVKGKCNCPDQTCCSNGQCQCGEKGACKGCKCS